MQLLETEIQQFQKICKEYCGVELSSEEAEEAGMSLVRLMKQLILPEENQNESESRTTTSEA